MAIVCTHPEHLHLVIPVPSHYVTLAPVSVIKYDTCIHGAILSLITYMYIRHP
jgi:hypothetical protein